MIHKLVYSLLFSILFSQYLIAQQVPQGMSYQAIARDGKGNLLTNSQIDIVFTIIDGSINGSTLYKEQQVTTSNNQGLFTMIIGKGKPLQGTFDKIPWANKSEKFLKIELGVATSPQLTLLGTTQLLSVPYALMAQKAIDKPDSMSINDLVDVQTLNISSNDVLTFNGKDWVNKPQSLFNYKSGMGIIIKNDTIAAIDNSINNEIQTISQKGDTILLSKNGGSVITKSKKYFAGSNISIKNDTISSVTSGVPAINVIGAGGTTVTSTGNNYTIKSPKYFAGSGIAFNQDTIQNTGDLNSMNEIQTLSIANSTITLSKGGGSVTVPSSNYNAGNGISISNNTISASDNSPINEIQQLSINGSVLSISNGNSVQLPNFGGGSGSFDPLGPSLLYPQGLRGTVVHVPNSTPYQLPAGKVAYFLTRSLPDDAFLYYKKGPATLTSVSSNSFITNYVIFDASPNVEIIDGTFSQYTVPTGKYFYGTILNPAIGGTPGAINFASEGQIFSSGSSGSITVNGYLINK